MPHAPFQKKRPTILSTSVAALLSFGLLLGAPRATADEYWDGTTTIGSDIPGGKGSGDGDAIWDISTTNWVDANGSNPTTYKPNQTAIFAGVAGVVTLGTNISFTALHFEADNYFIEPGGGPLTPVGAASITVDQGDRATIDAQIVGNGSITVNGPGTLTVNNSNTYTGGTTLTNNATVFINNSNALGTGPLIITGPATIGTTAVNTKFANPISIQTTSPLTFQNGPNIGTFTVDGLVDLTGVDRTINGTVVKEQVEFDTGGIGVAGDPAGLTFTTGGNATGVGNYVAFIMGAPDNNHYAGLTTIENTAFLVFESNIAGGSVKGNVLIKDNGVVDYLGGASAQFNSSTIVITDNSIGDTASLLPFTGFDMFNSTGDTIGTLNGTGTVGLSAATLTLSGGNFSGQISNGAHTNGSGFINGGGIIKVGSGTLTLTGMNNYTGTTVISGGTLQAAADNTLSPNSAFTVSAGATLDLTDSVGTGHPQTVGSIGGGGTINLGSATLTTGTDNTSTSFTGTIQGTTGGLTKIGTGTFTLSGANTYGGATTINGGTLAVTSGLSSSSSLALGGGIFSFVPSTAPATQTLNGLTVNQGSSAISVSSSNTLSVGNITRNAGGVVDFGVASTVNANGTIVPTDPTGILGAWATVNNGGALAALDSSGNIIAFAGYTSLGAQGDTLLDGSANVQINAQGPSPGSNTVIGSPTTSINTLSQSLTLAQSPSGADSTIDTSPGLLRVGVIGGIFITPGAGNLTIGTSANSGTLTAGGASSGTAGELILANFSGNGSILKINSTIADNSGGVVSVTVAGTGITELAGTNTYSGATVVVSGTLQTDVAGAIPTTSAVTVQGGAVNLNGVTQTWGSLSDGGSTTGTITLGGAALTLSGVLTGGTTGANSTFAGLISDGSAGTGGQIIVNTTGTVTLSNPANSYSGGTTLNSGTLDVNGSARDGSGTPLGTGPLTINGGTLGTTIQPGNFGTGTTILNAVAVNGSFNIATNVNTVDQLAQNITLNGAITLGANAGGTITPVITGVTAGSAVHFGGVISEATNDAGGGVSFATSSTVQADANHPYVKFIYQGTNANTYTGLTMVGTGAVLILNSQAVAVPGNLTIAAGGVAFMANSGQIASTSTVEVDGGNVTVDGAKFAGWELAGTSQTIMTLNGGANGTIALGSAPAQTQQNVAPPANLTVTNGTFAGVISDGVFGTGGTLTQSGSGTLLLSGNNTYTGLTTILGGTIQVGVDNALPPTSIVAIGGNGTLDLNGHDQTIGGLSDNATGSTGTVLLGGHTLTVGTSNNPNALAFSGSISGVGGSFVKVGSGSLDLTGTNSYTGPTLVNGGTLEVDGTITSPVTVGQKFAAAVPAQGGNPAIPEVPAQGATFILGAKGTIDSGPGTTPMTLNTGSTLINDGQLSVTGSGSIGVSVPHVADNLGGIMIFNNQNALISGETGIFVGNQGGIVQIINNGTITGTGVPGEAPIAIDGRLSAGITLYNFGTINGQVLFGPGNNTVVLATGEPTAPVHITPPSATATLRLAGGSAGEFSLNDFTGFASLVKVGGGLFTVTGSGNFPNGTTIEAGTINLTGTLTSNVLNQLNGTLTGTGTIIGNVVSFGALMPGFALGGVVNPTTALGTLTIHGNYTQLPQGQLVIQVGGNQPGSFDSLIVSGHASLAGTLELQQLGKGPKLGLGQSIPILLASGGVTGKFGTVYNSLTSNTAVIPTLVYEPNAVVIEGTQGSFQALQHVVSYTSNENAVAVMLDKVSADHRVFPLINYLDGRNVQKLPADFDKIAPEEASSIYRLGVSLSDVQSNSVQRRASDLRAGISGFTAAGFQTTGGPGGITGLAGPNGDESKVTTAAPVNRNWGAFITGVGDFIHVGNSENARGYNLDTGGIVLGADYKFNENFAVGVMAGYTGTDSKLSDNSHLAVNGGKLGVYGTYWENGFYGDFLASGGYNGYELRRTALQGDAHGTTQGGQADVLVVTGYDWRIDALTIGPTASFEYTYLGMSGYDERGSLAPLRYPTQHNESLRFTIGVKATYDLQVGNVIVRPEAQLAWQHEAGPGAATIDAGLVSGPGTLFSVSDANIGRDSLLMTGGVSVLWNPRTSTYLYYDADLFRREYYSQSFTGGLRMNF